MKILLATDGSQESRAAQALLASLPLAPGTEIVVVTVLAQPHLIAPGLGREGELRAFKPPADQVNAAEALAAEVTRALARAGVAVAGRVETGHPTEVICSAAENEKADLIVVGSHGRSAVGRFFLGSVSSGVVKHASVPVLIARPQPPLRTVMIGVDGSPGSRRAVEYLSRFPLPRETEVTALSVVYVPPPYYGGAEGYYETEELTRALETVRRAHETEANKALSEAAAILGKPFRVETQLVAGTPARTLLDLSESKGAQLVVVGSRGLTGVERFVMGSVSLQVTYQAKASVLVVR